RLKPGLSWHDGAPLTSDDFVFAWQLYGRPELGLVRRLPMDVLDSIAAVDERTFVTRWKRAYPDAGTLTDRNAEFPALPRHLLKQQFDDASMDGGINHAYWNRDFVGLGPYRLDRWELGAFIEASAFGGHVGGPPRISRIRLLF